MSLCYSTSPEEFLARLSAHEDTKKEPVATKQKDFSLPGINVYLIGGINLVNIPSSPSPFLLLLYLFQFPSFRLLFSILYSFLSSFFAFFSFPYFTFLLPLLLSFLSFFYAFFSFSYFLSAPSRSKYFLWKSLIMMILFYRTSSRWWIWRCRS